MSLEKPTAPGDRSRDVGTRVSTALDLEATERWRRDQRPASRLFQRGEYLD